MPDTNLFDRLNRDAIFAGIAGVVVALVVGAVAGVLGHVSAAEASRLVEAILPTSRLLCSSLLTVSATTLALMLTLIGMGSKTETKLADAHYHRIVKIAFYDTILFATAAIMFVLHCVPVYESESLPSWWYPAIYYGVLVVTSLLAGGAVAIIVLLYLAVKDVVQVIGLGVVDHYLAKERESDGKEADTSDEKETHSDQSESPPKNGRTGK